MSKPQLALHEMLGGELNFPAKRYHIDIALFDSPQKIAVEYDCWYYHERQRTKAIDEKRDQYLLEQGWHILRIKSGTDIPTMNQLDEVLARLRGTDAYGEIILPDWRG